MLLTFSALAAFQFGQIDIKLARRVQQRSPEVTEKTATVANVELWVSDAGRVVDCIVKRFVGDEEIANRMCQAAIGGRVAPSRDHHGDKIYSVIRTSFSITPGSDTSYNRRLFDAINVNPLPADVELDVTDLPDNEESLRTGLSILIGESGIIELCIPNQVSKPELGKAACAAVSSQVFPRRINKNQQSVKYIRGLSVQFNAIPKS